MANRITLTETSQETYDKINNKQYLIQFDVENNVYYLKNLTNNDLYDMPSEVQTMIDSDYWRYRDPEYWEKNYN